MNAVLKETMTRKSAWDLVAGLSTPSKMPGYAYGLPAKECKVGGRLQSVAGSVCHGCYALKGQYRFQNVQDAQYRRLASLADPRWVDAMVFLMFDLKIKWFRWHDSGDIQTPSHLNKIVSIARTCSKTRFWMPTREKVFVYSHLKQHGSFPKNLVVRLSGAMVDGPAPLGYPHTSTVSTNGLFSETRVTCPAHEQNNECRDCRKCWDHRVRNVAYAKH